MKSEMNMKLWQGRFEEDSDPVFEKMNRSLGIDAVLLEVDIRASRAHARALLGCGVLSQEEWKAIDQGLEQILSDYTLDQVEWFSRATKVELQYEGAEYERHPDGPRFLVGAAAELAPGSTIATRVE